eukprot:SAG11_NODE_489_length_8994_cov_8.385904_8_plen_108_part_00
MATIAVRPMRSAVTKRRLFVDFEGCGAPAQIVLKQTAHSDLSRSSGLCVPNVRWRTSDGQTIDHHSSRWLHVRLGGRRLVGRDLGVCLCDGAAKRICRILRATDAVR